jgi:copper chaperone CopZ
MLRKIVLFLALILPAATLAAETLTFKVVGIDCSKCAPPIVKALKGVSGVTAASVDAKAKTATVDVPSGFDREKLRAALDAAGFEAVFAGEKPRDIEPLPAAVIASLDIVSYTDGRRVDLGRIVAPAKVTVVDFYADWCGPCHVLEVRLQHLMQGRSGLAVRRVNIGKWDNDAAKQVTELHAEALPYLRVYDKRGKFVTAVTGGMWDEVLAAIAKGEE